MSIDIATATTMPEIHDPSQGSRLGARRRRSRKRKQVEENSAQIQTVAPEVNVRATSTGSPSPTVVSSKVLSEARHGNPQVKTILKKTPQHHYHRADVFEFTTAVPDKAGNEQSLSLVATNAQPFKKKVSIETPPPRGSTTVVTDIKDDQTCDGRKKSLFGESYDCCLRHVVAVDTRHLDTPEGKEEYKQFHHGLTTFLQASCHRGMTPSCIAWLVEDRHAETQVKCASLSEETLGSTMRRVVTTGYGITMSSSGIPEGLEASKTWSLFSEMVVRIIEHETTSNQNDASSPVPLCVTILSSDISSLLETSHEEHQDGIDSFMDDVEGHFGHLLQAMRIVFVTGTTVIVSTTDLVDAMQTDEMPPSCNDFAENSESAETLFNARLRQISLLINKIQRRIDSRIDDHFRQNRSKIQFDSKTVSKMDVTLSSIDTKLGFHRLLQSWSQEILSACPQSNHQSLQIQLPETIEFDACVVRLQASYKIFPYRLDSPRTQQLLSELEKLSRAELKIIQMTPIDSIDASLLLGIGIGLRAGPTDSAEEHTHNLMLLQSLFKTLASKDCALLIRATYPLDVEGSGTVITVAQDVQYFVLMPELLGSKTGKITTNGVLHRIACADYLVEQNAVHHSEQAFQTDVPQENPFEECVEASLEALVCSPFNPLSFLSFAGDFDQEVELPSAVSPLIENKKVTWKDDTIYKDKTVTHTTSSVKLCLAETFDKAINLGTNGKDLTETSNFWMDDSGVGLLLKEEGKQMGKQQDEEMKQDKETIWKDDSRTGLATNQAQEMSQTEEMKVDEQTEYRGELSSEKEDEFWEEDSGVGSFMKRAQQSKEENEAETKQPNDSDDEMMEEEVEDEFSEKESTIQDDSETYEHSSSKASTKLHQDSEIEDDIDDSSNDSKILSLDRKPKRKPTELVIRRSSPQKKEHEAEWKSASSTGSSSGSSSSSDTDNSDDDSRFGKFQY